MPVKNAGAQLLITGDFDARMEYLNLRRIVPDSVKSKSVNFSGSAELDFGYHYKRLDAFLSLSASYSSGTNLFSYANPGSWSGNAYEVWLRYQFSKYFSLQAGRIELSYDDEQFFQARDWNHLITSHNAVVAHWHDPDSGFMADMGIAANKFTGTGLDLNTDPTVNNYRYLGFLYVHKKFLDEKILFTFSDIFDVCDNGISKDALYGRNTLGGNGWLTLHGSDLFVTGYYQFGHVYDGRKLSAFYYAGYLGHHFTDWLSLMAAYEHMSGDDFTDTTKMKKVAHGFSMLYGNSVKTQGRAGFFNYAFRSNTHPGLNNLYLMATFDITEKISIEATYHWYSVPHPYVRELDSATNQIKVTKVSSSLLHEVDILFTYSPVKSIVIEVNYSLLIPGRTMRGFNNREINSSNLFSYAYIDIEFSPTIFDSKRKQKHLR